MRVRALRLHDVTRALALLAEQPFAQCFAMSALERGHLQDFVGVFDGDTLRSVAYTGVNCVPARLTQETAINLADFLATTGRRSASIIGQRQEVQQLWDALDGRWGIPRAVRMAQPLMLLDGEPLVAPDPLVRRLTPDDFDTWYPAHVAMFTEEVGISPIANGAEPAYRARLLDQLREGRAFARVEDGRVVSMTHIGAVSSRASQLQGVWVAPERRGQGLAAPAVAAVAAVARQAFAPNVTLYVNDFNIPARNTYRRVGFREIDAFRTIFF